MDYFAYTFICNPPIPLSEILISQLADIGFESFEENENGAKAYIPENLHDSDSVHSVVDSLSGIGSIEYTNEHIPDQNWNAVWESEYPVVTIGKQCIVRAPFHKVTPGEYDLDILINPQMSFGTGHHETTYLVLSMLIQMDVQNKTLLDMGSGTGVLAIGAKKLGASRVDAIDSEEWAYKNTVENVELNDVDIHVQKAEVIPQESPVYDVILANINKNVLIMLMPEFEKYIKTGGTLVLSGFFKTDLDVIRKEAANHNFQLEHQETKNTWLALKFNKK